MAAVLDDVLRNLCSRARVLSSFIRMTEPWLFAENCHAFVHAGSFDEVKPIRDHAKALRVYTRSIGAALDAVNAAAELRIRAERRMGEALRDAEKSSGGRPRQVVLQERGDAAPDITGGPPGWWLILSAPEMPR